MRSPVRSLPPNVGRWASRARWLRRLDALAAWLLVWGGLALTPYAKTPGATAVAAAVLVGLAPLLSPIRRRRPRLVRDASDPRPLPPVRRRAPRGAAR